MGNYYCREGVVSGSWMVQGEGIEERFFDFQTKLTIVSRLFSFTTNERIREIEDKYP